MDQFVRDENAREGNGQREGPRRPQVIERARASTRGDGIVAGGPRGPRADTEQIARAQRPRVQHREGDERRKQAVEREVQHDLVPVTRRRPDRQAERIAAYPDDDAGGESRPVPPTAGQQSRHGHQQQHVGAEVAQVIQHGSSFRECSRELRRRPPRH
jgi:hypothetical protein